MISVIICTYNRVDMLGACLGALKDQVFSSEGFEIIVVDNNSSDGTKKLVLSFQKMMPNLKYVLEIQQGVSFSRNKGFEKAEGKIVAYLDDDSVVDSFWLSSIKEVFDKDSDAGFCGGPISPVFLMERIPAWLGSSYCRGYYAEYMLPKSTLTRVNNFREFPYGCNMAFLKSALQDTGGFNCAMGRIGRSCDGGEELEAALNVFAAGLHGYYHPLMAVKHIMPAHRVNKEYILKNAVSAAESWKGYAKFVSDEDLFLRKKEADAYLEENKKFSFRRMVFGEEFENKAKRVCESNLSKVLASELLARESQKAEEEMMCKQSQGGSLL